MVVKVYNKKVYTKRYLQKGVHKRKLIHNLCAPSCQNDDQGINFKNDITFANKNCFFWVIMVGLPINLGVYAYGIYIYHTTKTV